jgi:ParB family chromosome partitioning protein
LDALLGASAPEPDAGGDALLNLDIEVLQPGKFQPRSRMNQAALTELADSIKAHGVMQPILVRPLGVGHYEIIAGERRWRAARMAGLRQVPALLHRVDDHAAMAMALIENIQREDLNALEQAHGLQRLIAEFGMTHEAVAAALGRSRSAVTNLLRLLALAPPVQALLGENALDMGHARALLALDAAFQLAAARTIVDQGMSVREAERMVARMLKQPAPKSSARKDRDILRLQDELSERLGTRVVFAPGKKGRGRLTIEYQSLEHLDRLLAMLR